MIRFARVLLIAALAILLFDSFAYAQPDSGAAPAAKKLVVGVLDDPPFLVKSPDGSWSGLNYDIWNAIARDMKVDYELSEMEFPDLIGALRDGKIDLAIAPFFITAERAKLFDYSYAFGNTRIAVAMLPEKAAHPWLNAVRIVLSWGTLKVVGMLAISLCLLGFILWFVERKHNPDHFGGGAIKGIGTGIYWVGSTLASGVCFGITLRSTPARILGLVWMLLCAIALSALIASLSAALSASRSIVETVSDDALREMYLGGVEAGAEAAMLKKLGGHYKLYEDENAALAALMRHEIEGVVYDEITLEYFRANDYRNRIAVYPTRSRRYSFAFGMPKDSPLRSDVDSALLNLMEGRDWSFMLQRYGLEENYDVRQTHMLHKK